MAPDTKRGKQSKNLGKEKKREGKKKERGNKRRGREKRERKRERKIERNTHTEEKMKKQEWTKTGGKEQTEKVKMLHIKSL